MRFYCQYCSFCCASYRVYMRHSFESHSSSSAFSFLCGINGCVKSFSKFSAIKSHIARNHGGINLDSVEINGRAVDRERQHDNVLETADSFDETRENSPPLEVPDPNCDDRDLQVDNEPDLSSRFTQMQRSMALFILTLKEKYKVTQAAIDFTVTQMKDNIDFVIDDLHQAVDKEIQKVPGLSEDDAVRITSIFSNFSSPFTNLETQYFQSKFYEENFGLIQPVTIHLGTSTESTASGMDSKRDTFQYIPLLDGLVSLLKIPEIYSEVMKPHARSDNLMGDYCDAELFKSIPLFGDHVHSLQIIMFFDEMETCNPLGGHAGVHKLGLFYYVLGNIRPELRSTLKAIQLIACVTCSNLNKYGFEKILSPFIEDVNTLSEDGITVDVNGISTHFYGTVLLLLADTLAAHQIGGFKVGVSFALRKCRVCLASIDDMSNKFFESDFTLRDPESHDYHCSLLDGILAAEDSTTYGVNQTSVLNKINYFHVTNQLPQDIMHVLFEGVLNLETRLMISYFVNKSGYFTLDFLNQRIANFTYGRAEKQAKPPRPFTAANLTGSKLPLSASQMWNFSILLPLIIGDKIPINEPLWSCYILLLDIVKYCTAQLTSVESAEHLAALIDQHHREFKKCYPAVSITPKLHYMVHLPGLLIKLGPLVNCWCMRMEAKHSYFKRISQIGNFKNIPYSVAVRHQKLLCASLQGPFFEYNLLKSGPYGSPNKLQDEADAIQETIIHFIPNISLEASVVRPNWIKIYGEEFHRQEFVHMGWQENDLPLFVKISDIISVEEFPFFMVEKYKSVGINEHLLGYLIQRTHITCCINIADLPYKYVFSAHSYIGDGQLYIVPKSYLELLNIPRLSVD